MKMKDNDELRKKYMELQMLHKQIAQYQEHIQGVGEQISNIHELISALSELSKRKKGEEVLVPIANGIYFKTELKDKDRFLVNVGKKVVVEKNFEETVVLLKEQIKELESYRENSINAHNTLVTKAKEIEKEFE